MNIIKAVVEGQEEEFEILIPGDRTGTHRISNGAIFINLHAWADVPLRLIRKRHTFGVITLEETGEKADRFNRGDWYLDSAGLPAPVGCLTKLTSEYPILRPVAPQDKMATESC